MEPSQPDDIAPPPPAAADDETESDVESDAVALTTDEGVMKTLITPPPDPSSSPVPPGASVQVHYTGKLHSDGTVFDSSVGKRPFDFVVGSGSVIKGFDIAVMSMRKGERASFTLRPDYAYGVAGSPPAIPSNATLVFDLEVIDFVSLGTSEERLDAAERHKSEGAASLRRKRITDARRSFVKGAKLLTECEQWSSSRLARQGLVTRALCHLNLSLLLLQTSAPLETFEEAGKGLEAMSHLSTVSNARRSQKETSILLRLYFVRAKASKALQQFNEALADLTQCLRLQPSNKGVKKEKRELLKLIRRQ